MKTKTAKTEKPKRGTIGYSIAKLVKRYGHYTTGLYILEQALAQSLGADSSMRFKVTGALGTPDLLMHELPRYKELAEEEGKILARVTAQMEASK
jgi:hypothetical protein